MSTLTIVKKLELPNPIKEQELIEILEKAINRDFDKVRLKKDDSSLILNCRVNTKLFNPILSIKGVVDINIKDNLNKIMIDADTKTNFWFWFQIILGFVPPFTAWWWFIMIWQWHSQKKLSVEAMNKVMERIQFQLEGI